MFIYTFFGLLYFVGRCNMYIDIVLQNNVLWRELQKIMWLQIVNYFRNDDEKNNTKNLWTVIRYAK